MQKNDQNHYKVGFVLDDGLDRPDGVQQYILTLGAWLQARGHEVHYLVGETKRTDIKHVHSLASNVKVVFNGNKLTIPLPANKNKVETLVNREDFDILHIQVPYSPFFGAMVVKAAAGQTKVIGTFHILPYGKLAFGGTRLLGFYLRRNLRGFDSFISVSEPARIFAKQTFSIDSKVIPNMVDTSRFKPVYKKYNDTPKLLFVGRLVERKGCSLLLKALADLRRKRPDIRFHLDVCGRGELQNELKSYCRQVGLSPYVKFHGFVSEEEKVVFMQQSDMAIFPSFAGESFGIVLIEAMAAGTFVLGGNNPGYASVLADVPEAILNVKNISKFSKKLEKFLTDWQYRDALQKKQQVLVKQFDVDTVCGQILEEYDNLKNKRYTKG